MYLLLPLVLCGLALAQNGSPSNWMDEFDPESAYLSIISLTKDVESPTAVNSTVEMEMTNEENTDGDDDEVPPPPPPPFEPERRPRPFPPGPRPGPPGRDRCGAWGPWQQAKCWWPDEPLSKLPPACAAIPTKKEWPSWMKQFVAAKAMEKYNMLMDEFKTRGAPQKCGYCARSFECRVRNDTDAAGRGFCPMKQIRPMFKVDCDDHMACEVSQEKGGCPPPLFLGGGRRERLQEMIKSNDHEAFSRELFTMQQDNRRRRQKRQAPFNGGMGPQFMPFNPQFDFPYDDGRSSFRSGPSGSYGGVPFPFGPSQDQGFPVPRPGPSGDFPRPPFPPGPGGFLGPRPRPFGPSPFPPGPPQGDFPPPPFPSGRPSQDFPPPPFPGPRLFGPSDDFPRQGRGGFPRSPFGQGAPGPQLGGFPAPPFPAGPSHDFAAGPRGFPRPPFRPSPPGAPFAAPSNDFFAPPRGMPSLPSPFGPTNDDVPFRGPSRPPMGGRRGFFNEAPPPFGGFRQGPRFRMSMAPRFNSFWMRPMSFPEQGPVPPMPSRRPPGPPPHHRFLLDLFHGTTCASAGKKCLCCCGHYIPNVENGKCEDLRQLLPGIDRMVDQVAKATDDAPAPPPPAPSQPSSVGTPIFPPPPKFNQMKELKKHLKHFLQC